jgi:hypothetical protein
MASNRSNNNTVVTAETTETAEQKRTTYASMVNVTQIGDDGIERRLYGEETRRAYGEGGPTAVVNSVRDRLKAMGRSFDADTDVESPFVNRIEVSDTVNVYVGVLWQPQLQCGVCGAPRNRQHDWCPGCTGNIEIDVDAAFAAAKRAAKK